QLSGITSGADGNIWFAEYIAGINKIGKITTAGVITEYTITGNRLFGITSGPDGNIWFTSYGGGIMKLTTAGVIIGSWQIVPISGINPEVIVSITPGPD
ncbi:MAG: Virginiamycin B lyase, partial [Nitrospirae bacterium]|nr:Virginiamycin B lyase [Nitrospirota bacterium]